MNAGLYPMPVQTVPPRIGGTYLTLLIGLDSPTEAPPHAVDTLDWIQPKGAGETPAADNAMLPLIVGALEGIGAAEARDKPKTTDAAEEAEIVEGSAEPSTEKPGDKAA